MLTSILPRSYTAMYVTFFLSIFKRHELMHSLSTLGQKMSKTETRKLIAEVDTNQDGKLEKEVACTMHCYESHLYSNRSTMSNGEACASCVLIGVLALHSCIGLSLDCTHLCAASHRVTVVWFGVFFLVADVVNLLTGSLVGWCLRRCPRRPYIHESAPTATTITVVR